MNFSRMDVQKSQLRRQLRQRLARLTKSERQKKSQRILAKLMKTRDYLKAVNVFTYIALPSEVQTEEFIQKSLALRKHVFVPLIHPRKKEISIFEIRNLRTDLRKGRFGIPEPVKKRPGRPDRLDLVVVPGLGFDPKGGRLGRGEGYFDRFLLKTGKALKIGLSFREQLLRKIPSAKHDISMNWVIHD